MQQFCLHLHRLFTQFLIKHEWRAIYNLADRVPSIKFLFESNKPFYWKCLSNKFLFKIGKIFLLRFNTMCHWIQINIFIVVN